MVVQLPGARRLLPPARTAARHDPVVSMTAKQLPLADRVMKARRDSTCPLCPDPVRTGQMIARCGTTWYHAACVAAGAVSRATGNEQRRGQ
jgi:hypothetical protein